MDMDSASRHRSIRNIGANTVAPQFEMVCSGVPRDDASLVHLLSAVIGSPSVLIKNGPAGEDALAIVLLTACLLVRQSSDMDATAYFTDLNSPIQLFRL